MEKEYLGLGVVFNALDKGFTKSVETIQKALQGAGDTLAKVSAAANKGGGNIFGNLTEGFKLLSLSKIGGTLDEIQSGVAGTGHGINEAAKELDFMRAKMTAALDPKLASQFTSQLMGMTVSMGLTADQADTIANNLLNSGVAVDKMGESLPMIGTLVGKMGMDAGSVSNMFGQMQGYLHMSSRQAAGLTKEIFKLQKDYQLTNLMESLPEIVSNVYDNMLKLGKYTPEMASRMVQDVTKMAASFQKLGLSQSKATQTATGFNDKVNEVRTAFKDLQAGLDPQSNIIQDIYDAFGSGGLNATDLVNAIKSGKVSNEDIMKKMQGMLEGLDETQKNNVIQRLRRTFGDDITNIIGPMAKNMNDVNAQAAVQAKKVGTADDAWKGLTGQLNGTLQVSEKLRDAAKSYVDTLATLMEKGNIMKGLQAWTNAYMEQAKQVADIGSAWGEARRMLAAYNAVGLAGIVPDGMKDGIATIGVWTEALSKLIYPITSLLGILWILKTPISWLLNAFKLIGPLFTGVLGAVGEGATAFGLFLESVAGGAGVVESLAGAFALLSNPIGWVVAAVLAVGAAIGAVIYFWDDLIDIVGTFSKDGADGMRGFGKSVNKVWHSIMEVATTVWSTISDAVGWYITTIVNEFKFLGKVAVVVWDLIKIAAAAEIAVLIALWNGFSSAFSTIWNGVSKVVNWVIDNASEKITSFVTWISGIWNTVSTSVVSGLTSVFASIKALAASFYEVFKPIIDPVLNLFTGLKKTIGEMLGGIWDPMMTAFDKVKDKVIAGLSKISDAIPSFLKNDISSAFSAFKNIFSHGDAPKDAGSTTAAMAQGAGTVVSGSNMTGTPTSVLPPGTDNIAPAIPVKAQAGAPAMSNLSGIDLTPTVAPKLDDKNFQAIVDMLAKTKDDIVAAIAASGNKQVSITLQGDVRKFMTVLKQESAQRAGTGGMNAALGG